MSVLATPDSTTLEWFDVASWESSGDGDSPPFRVSADLWRVSWVAPHDEVGEGSFVIHVYNPDGYFVRALFNTADTPELKLEGSLRGALEVPDPGEYFLRILTSRDYRISVQELR